MTNYNPHDIHTYPQSFIEHGMHEGDDVHRHNFEKLHEIHVVLQGIHKLLENTAPKEITNIRYALTLYKSGQGANWIVRKQDRFYLYISAPVVTAINITAPALGAQFVLNIPAITLPNYWSLLDLPEQSSVILDTSATANQMNVEILLTNVKM